ncbi:hypothetical protein AAZV13_16G170500 [Glycine max]|uniref:uncharacterized protein n=1 Tax=Glycine max TaxID=3847 RepID=UPI00023D631E|nr:uncharacterized protein LOC100793127 [Glycine max]KAH1207039.1 hypothetical protein GmHk_16G047310 [Glycine max]|eukprot:XP_006599639.1 uncharacterized protein LOC100793127 [Glycine max]
MGDKGDTTKKQQSQQQQPQSHHHHQQQQQTQQQISSSPKAPHEEPITEVRPIHHHHHQQLSPVVVATGAPPFIPSPLYVSSGASSSPFEPQFETLNPKRPRYSGQWKQLLPSPPAQQKQSQMAMLPTSESSPSPTTHTSSNPLQQQQPQTQTASSSDTSSSPTHSLPLLSGEGTKQEGEQIHQQLRKGKYVSPVWKPNEMLWLARAWKEQYKGGGGVGGSDFSSRAEQQAELGITRAKTRADKDKEVAEFLKRHGVNRDAKTAGTKWDNMLGEFRKVYEWERGGEREQIGKSYFRLSPYERKLHRLPASFDEDVFEELAQFMGSRMRSSHGRAVSSLGSGDEARTALAATRALPPPPRPFKDDEIPLSARTKQLALTSGGEPFFHGSRGGLLGLDTLLDVTGSSSSSSKELRRIGKIRMSWEESVSLWAEEGEVHRGRVKLQSSSFLNADELTCFDDAMVPCPMEYFEDGPLKGFSVDRFVSGQQVKVFGRRKSSPASDSSSAGFAERVQFPSKALPIRSIATLDFRDPSDYYMECFLRASPQTLPSLLELKRHLQEPPPEDLRFPLRRDVYEDLPQGKELFFTTTSEPLDCRAIMFEIVGPIIRPSLNPTSSSRDSFIPLWDDCINRVIQKFCPENLTLIRKPTSSPPPTATTAAATATESTNLLLQDQWPNITGFVNNYCLWRGEETHQLTETQPNPSTTLVAKLLWTYMDLPYILGYYAVANTVTFCAMSRSQEGIINRTDLLELNLTTPTERLKALVPCFRIGLLLPLLSKRCSSIISNSKGFAYSDFERVCYGNGVVTEVTPNTCTRMFSEKRKWMAVKEVYEILDHRIPHAEVLVGVSERELGLSFKPRGCRVRPGNCEELVEALKYVTKALVALHDLSFMHRDLKWEKVMRRMDSREEEWFVCGFDEAAGAPELKGWRVTGEREGNAPEMERGLHGVKVDVWGVGNLIRTCGLGGVPKMLRELQSRCMEQNPEQRPTAADCYHHLLQLQSSLSAATAAAGGGIMM